MQRKFVAALLPVLTMALTLLPSAYAATTYTQYNWSVSCSGNGTGTATTSWQWYAGSTAGSPAATGIENCTGTSSSSGTCPSQGVCSLGRPSNATTLIASISINCGSVDSKSITQSVTPGTPVSVTVSLTVKHGNCNGTYDRGTETATLTLTA